MDTHNKETQLLLLPDSTDLPQPSTMPIPAEPSEQQPQQIEVAAPLNHICNICHEGFRSGQALGGHKTMHRESEPNSYAASTSIRRDPICCLVCGKDFFSKKVLLAHVRSHNNSSNSSSTVSDEEAMFDDGVVDSGPPFDFSKALPAAWPPIGKRKRRPSVGASSSSDSGEPKPEAEDYTGLVMLAHMCAEEANNQNGNEIEFVASESKRRRLNDACERKWSAADHYGYMCKGIEDEFRCKFCDKTFTTPQALGGHTSSHNRSLKINAADHVLDSVHNSVQHPQPHYSCNVCDKTFSTYQALGGHKSSCKDVNINNTSNIAVREDNVPEPHQVVQVYACDKCNRTFPSYQALGGHTSSCHTKNKDMDREQSNSADTSSGSAEVKNEKLEEKAPHQCKKCNQIYRTGQALGGHQRLHYKRPTEAATKQSQQSSEGRLLDLDLNALPTMEDEEGIYVPGLLLTL